MTVQDIITIVQSVGFPIVMCGAMGYYVKYVSDRHREEMQAERTQHDAEMSKVTEAIHNNTIALQKLIDCIDK